MNFLHQLRRAGSAALLLGLASWNEANAQRVTRLTPPSAVLTEPFGRVVNVRELPDGRVIVSDGPEKRLVVANFVTQEVRQIGRNGSGPGEYENAGVVHGLRGDTTLMTDAATRRWLLLVGDRIISGVSADHPAVVATQGVVLGSSASGRLLSWVTTPPKPGVEKIGPGDSTTVISVALADGIRKDVTRIQRATQTRSGWDDVGGRPFYFTTRDAFTIGEAALVAPDDWVAIARIDPYRVDWVAPDGRLIRGAPIPYTPVRVTAREKAFYLKRFERVAQRPPTLPPGLTAEQRAAVLAGLQRQWTEFPAFVPPFEAPSITAISTEHAFIRRTVTADSPDPIFDVVDRRGRLVARLQLAKGERLLGTGRGCVYVAAEDDDGLDHLRRHPWP